MRGQLFRCLESCDGDVTVPEHGGWREVFLPAGRGRPRGCSVLLWFGAQHSSQERLASCGQPTPAVYTETLGASYSTGPWPRPGLVLCFCYQFLLM